MNFRLLLTYLHIINMLKRVNYHAINDGSDKEAPELSSQSTIDSFASHELILPEDSMSHVPPSPSMVIDLPQSDIFLPSGPFLNPRIKPHNQWLWTQYSINLFPGRLWQPKRAKASQETD
jgi:hypothetical protein